MKKNLITFSVIFLLLSCSSNELSTNRISKIVYDETGDEYSYVYNEDGTLSQIETKYFQATGVHTQSFFHTETSTITSSIYYLNYFEFDSEKLIKYVSKYVFNDNNILDTVSFEYNSLNNLSVINHNNISYSVKVDDRGNIIEVAGDNKTYQFTYDKKPNPFQSIPNNSMVEIVEEDIKFFMVFNIVQYFSKNNILTFSGWNGSNNMIILEYVYGLNGYPRKVIYKNSYGDHHIYYDSY